ncbi:hypothetical protein KI688_002524 [Linnemannia hyalina]|uniref:HIG1 domain-containing protein n=1 Tax=Linnemannia hyalina TaxID=64524 RepID=A0A9P8BRP1_9FUNG|nr:hypothetical protein KI688_002524 [Linnemannia hyalina]
MAEEYYYDEDTETAMEKVKRLFRENKVVASGNYGVRTGRREFAQHMFRARVGFQFFTLAALLGGGMFYDKKRKDERLAIEQDRMVALDQHQQENSV